MTRRRWYCIALFLPIIIPIMSLLLAGGPTGLISTLSFGSLMYGGPSYIVLAAGLIWLQGRKKTDDWARLSWLLPLFFFPVHLLGLYMTEMVLNFNLTLASLSWRDVRDTAFVSAFVIPIGYFYVFLTHALTWMLQKMNLVHD